TFDTLVTFPLFCRMFVCTFHASVWDPPGGIDTVNDRVNSFRIWWLMLSSLRPVHAMLPTAPTSHCDLGGRNRRTSISINRIPDRRRHGSGFSIRRENSRLNPSADTPPPGAL